MDTPQHDGMRRRAAPENPLPGARRGYRARPRLAVEITVALVVKFAALAVIWNLWFAQPASERVDPSRIGAAVYSSEAGVKGGRAHARP